MTDVWWRASGLWKIHLSSQLKLRVGKRATGYGGREVTGLPPVRSAHLGTCGGGEAAVRVCVFAREKDTEKERERANKCVSDSWTQARWSLGVVLAAPFHLNAPTLPLHSLLPYLFCAVFPTPPSPFCHAARNLFPEAEATLMWEAQRRQSETQTLLRHTHAHTQTHTHARTHIDVNLHLKHRHTLRAVSYLTWRHGMHVLYFPPWSNTVSPSSTTT